MEKETPTKQKKAEEVLYNKLKHMTENTQIKIVEALGEIGPSTAKLLVKIALDTDNEAAVRDLAISTLGSMGGPAISALINELKSDSESDRQEAERALSIIGSPAITRLIEALKDFNTRDHPEKALSQMRPPPVKALKDAFEKNKDNNDVLKRIILTFELTGESPILNVGPTLDFLKDIVLQRDKFSNDVRDRAVNALHNIAKELTSEIGTKRGRIGLANNRLLLITLKTEKEDPERHEAWVHYSEMAEYLDSLGTDIDNELKELLNNEDSQQSAKIFIQKMVRIKLWKLIDDLESLAHVKEVTDRCNGEVSGLVFTPRMTEFLCIKKMCEDFLLVLGALTS